MRWFPITRDELKSELLRQSDILYDGIFAPGIMKFNTMRPRPWCGARSILKRFGYPINTKGWRILVHELTGLPLVTHSESQLLHHEAIRYAESLDILRRERMVKLRRSSPHDPDEYPTGVKVSSRRVIGRRVYLLLK